MSAWIDQIFGQRRNFPDNRFLDKKCWAARGIVGQRGRRAVRGAWLTLFGSVRPSPHDDNSSHQNSTDRRH